MTEEPDLVNDELELTGRLASASNATFVGQIGEVVVVYKPVAGEKPLWDFPDGPLAHREVAAYLVSESLGWDTVPRTWLRDGRFGVGMVQIWQEPDATQQAVTVTLADQPLGEGWRHVFDGVDERDRPVSLIHEDSPVLRQMAVFDIITNNADRKGGHVLEMTDGHRYGVDHGLTFHAEHKLRTVLWGWSGDTLTADELAGVQRVRSGLAGDLGASLAELLTPTELTALADRCERLLDASTFPAPEGHLPAIPWPPF